MTRAPPLREPLLAGAFFGERHRDVAGRVAGFPHLAQADALAEWFGAGAVTLLRAGAAVLAAALDRDIAAIDALLAAAVDAILHHDRLRALEGRWRGLAWLLASLDRSARVKLRLMDASWPELCRDLERAPEFDQSQLFRKIYEEEFGSPGGEPFGLLVIDHEARHRPTPQAPTDDIGALAQLAGVAAAAFVPTVLAASPALLQVGAFSELATVEDIAAPFSGPEYDRWRGLASREDMRFLALVLPRVLARPPWPDDPARADGFRYREHAPDCASRVWMNGGFAFASVVIRAFAANGWPADVRGAEVDRIGGGLVTDLPTERFSTDPDHVWNRPALELAVTDRQERALVDLGLMPLSCLPYGEELVFGVVRSLHRPPRFTGAAARAAEANAQLSAQINSMLCVSRFAHYVKMMGRDMVGAFRSAEEVERQLQEWLHGYVNGNLAAGSDIRARYPLAAAEVSVRERPGLPGSYSCTVRLQPHFQLDDVSASFRLVTDISAPGSSRAA